jgi:predicted nucleic acid-binding protein
VDTAYFESSVYIAIFNGEERAQEVKSLVRELRREHAKICTSIITVQEVSVVCYRAGGTQIDNYAKVERLTDRIYGVNREIVLMAAELEAQLLDRAKKLGKPKGQRVEEHRHVATALHLNCHRLYSFDPHLKSISTLPMVRSLIVSEPKPKTSEMFGSSPGIPVP